MKFRNYLTLTVLFLTICTSAQDTGEDELGFWAMYFGTNRITDELSIHTEIQHRSYEFASNFNQLLLRTGLNYHFTDNAIATIGYGYIETDPTFPEPDGEENSTENRIFQQFILKNKIGKFQFSHRYRLEQRFLENPVTGSSTEHRGRYFLRITYPIDNNWFLTAYEEVFINLQEPIFGQNRLYGAVGYKFTKNVSTQVGYLKNHFTGKNFDRFQIGIWWNTDLRKKAEDSSAN